MKKVLFVVLLWILVYFASPWSDGLHFIEKRGTTVINDYLYELPTDWEVWLLSFSGFLYSNADEDFLTGFLSSLENSRTISLQTYELSDSNVKEILKNTSLSWANIRILTEGNRQWQIRNTFKDLQTYFWDTTTQIRNDDHLPTQYLHSNFIITSSWFWLQTADLNENGLNKYRDYFLYSESPEITSSLRYIFEKDWIGEEIDSERIHPNVVVCNLNCRAVITDLITKAKSSIVLQMEDISDPSIFALLSQKPSEIVYKENDYWRIITWDFEFKAIFPNEKINKPLVDSFWSWNVRLMRKPYSHTRIMVIDHQWLLIGSMNFNHESLDTNRDIWILINDPLVVEHFLSWFNADWSDLDRYYCPYWGCPAGVVF